MLEELIVKYSAPTLAGLKPGNLFGCRCNECPCFESELRHVSSVLKEKGVEVRQLKQGERALIYVYRPEKLWKQVSEKATQRFLARYGYSDLDLEGCLERLSSRITGEDFPHEIGVFLGYPLHDVVGFIVNGGKRSKCTGYWKVYCNVDSAQNTFAKFAKCTRIYVELYAQGRDISRLTVAM